MCIIQKSIICNIIRMLKSSSMRWASYVARVWQETLTERDHFEDPGRDATIIIKWILKK
jgi:hypothetical protein